MPTAWAPIVGRVKSRVRSAVLKPVPGAPMIRSAGMVQSVKYSSQVGEPLMPILRSLGPTAKPGSSRWTAKAEMPLAPSSGSVTAMIVYHSEIPELVIRRDRRGAGGARGGPLDDEAGRVGVGPPPAVGLGDVGGVEAGGGQR